MEMIAMSDDYEPRHAAPSREDEYRPRRRGLPWPVSGLIAGVGIALLLRFFVIGVF